jgi:hypothetical protein
MFVKISGFHHSSENDAVVLPDDLRNPASNTSHVTLAVVRWLSPHPDAILRDSHKLPICPAPFDMNHALWKYTRVSTRRRSLSGVAFQRQLELFGSDDVTRLQNLNFQAYARYDLVQPESFESFMNCTPINGDACIVLETITIPF